MTEGQPSRMAALLRRRSWWEERGTRPVTVIDIDGRPEIELAKRAPGPPLSDAEVAELEGAE